MNNKFLLIFFTLILIGGIASAQKVCYVSDSADPKITEIISSLNLEYALVTSSQIASYDYTSCDGLIVGSGTFSDASLIPVNGKNSLILNNENDYLYEWNIASYSVGMMMSKPLTGSRDFVNSINKNFADSTELYNNSYVEAFPLLRTNSAEGMKKIIVSSDSSDRILVGAFYPNGKMYDGSYSSKRLVYFGLTETNSWTSGTKNLFSESIRFILNGEDFDGDGYWNENDCNDKNIFVNPGAREIPFNGIDDDCKDGDLNDESKATCSERGGLICSGNTICGGRLFSSLDSTNCCLGMCVEKPLTFENIKACGNSSGNILIDIENVESNEEFFIGENKTVEVTVENHFSTTEKFYVRLSLYDMTSNKEVFNKKEKVDLDDNEYSNIEFDLNFGEEFKDGHKYYIYVNAYESDNESICSSDYVPIVLERESDSVIIDSLEIENVDELVCGDVVKLNVGLKNLGTNDENVYLTIRNSALNINSNRNIELERFGDDDETSEIFMLAIPDETVEGKYILDVTATIGSEEFKMQKEISVGECFRKSSALGTADETITLNEELTSEVKLADFLGDNKLPLILNMFFINLVMLSLVMLIYLKRRRGKR